MPLTVGGQDSLRRRGHDRPDRRSAGTEQQHCYRRTRGKRCDRAARHRRPVWDLHGGSGAEVLISGLTIANGNGAAGGIFNEGTLTVSHTVILGNQGNVAGGIFNNWIAVLSDSSVSNSGGSGLVNEGWLAASRSTISGNYSAFGGGIFNSGVMTLSNSTVSDNEVPRDLNGGGVFNLGAMTIGNSTISNNRAGLGGGIVSSSGMLQMQNTILAGNSAFWEGFDLWGHLASSGHNLIGTSHGGSGYEASDLLDVDPVLGPLQDNGGRTFTHALLTESPAIDAGDDTDAPEFDQRGEGFPRVVNGRIDIGAYEVQLAGPEEPVVKLALR